MAFSMPRRRLIAWPAPRFRPPRQPDDEATPPQSEASLGDEVEDDCRFGKRVLPAMRSRDDFGDRPVRTISSSTSPRMSRFARQALAYRRRLRPPPFSPSLIPGQAAEAARELRRRSRALRRRQAEAAGSPLPLSGHKADIGLLIDAWRRQVVLMI